MTFWNRNGYRFVGWYYNNELYDFASEVTSDITLEARFEAIGGSDTNDSFTVTFDSNGGSTVNSQTVLINQKAKQPSDPVREGYTFKEWQLNGKTYNFKTILRVVTNKTILFSSFNFK